MLILSRREGEQVYLTATESLPAGSRIIVQLCQTRGNKARLGITAPAGVFIIRAELSGQGLEQSPGPQPD